MLRPYLFNSPNSMDIKTLSTFEKTILLNIWELYEESKWLKKNGYFSRAYTLAHLGFEENAKITFLTFLAWDIFSGKKITSEDIHKIFASPLFTDHKLKLRMAFLKLPGYDYQSTIKNVNALNIFKNKSIYTDVFEKEMCKPSDFFGEKQASDMIEILGNTLQKRVEELGASKIEQIPRITDKVIEEYYKQHRVLFERKRTIQISPKMNYIDYLKDIIKNEKLFNLVKQLLSKGRQ